MLRRWLTTLSTVLLFLTVVAWGASYWNWWFAGDKLVVWLQAGAVEYTWDYLDRFKPFPHPRYAPFQPYRMLMHKTETHLRLALLDENITPDGYGHHGFFGWATTWVPHWRHIVPVYIRPKRVCHSTIPLWIPSLAFAILPTWSVVARVRRHWRSRHGLCVTCAYDLRGTDRVCPECGRESGAGPVPVTEKQPY